MQLAANLFIHDFCIHVMKHNPNLSFPSPPPAFSAQFFWVLLVIFITELLLLLVEIIFEKQVSHTLLLESNFYVYFSPFKRD